MDEAMPVSFHSHYRVPWNFARVDEEILCARKRGLNGHAFKLCVLKREYNIRQSISSISAGNSFDRSSASSLAPVEFP